MKTLECSSRGDKRFSAFYARVKLFGKEDSIENHYQLAKRINDFVPVTWKQMKGRKPTHFEINGYEFLLEHGISFYELMWVKYLDEHPYLVMLIRDIEKYEAFTDMFKSRNAVVCQADTISDYIFKGREYLLNKHYEFINLLGSEELFYVRDR